MKKGTASLVIPSIRNIRGYFVVGVMALRMTALAALIFAGIAYGAASQGKPAAPIRLAVIGDSLTAGLGLGLRDTFPARLQAALKARGVDVAVINAGVSGDTTAGGRTRLAWMFAKVAGETWQAPDAVILELGANDGLRGLDPEATFANLDAMLSRLAQWNVPVLLAGMLAPPNLGKDYDRQFKAVYTRLARKHDVVFYPFFLAGVAGNPALNQADGKHPNAAGVRVIVERILPDVERLLSRFSPRHGT